VDFGPKLSRRLCPSRRCHALISAALVAIEGPYKLKEKPRASVGALTFTGGLLEKP
jgi:hypothetical protein